MDDKHISAGLALLADDMAPVEVDIDEVIAEARLRNRRRQAITASALGTVAVLVMLTVAVATVGIGDNTPGPPPPTTTTTGPAIVNGQYQATARTDDRSRKLTDQLARAKSRVIPRNMRIEPDPKNAGHIIGGPPAPLEFVLQEFADLPSSVTSYTAFAKLSDDLGWGTLRIDVGHSNYRPGIENELVCPAGSKSCVTRDFPDRTKAVLNFHIATVTGLNQGMTALRPDGTYIHVGCDAFFFDQSTQPTTTRPTIPLSTDQLFELATVFTY